MDDPEPSSLIGVVLVFFVFGAICGGCTVSIYSDPMTMRNMYRTQLWEEAVNRGFAERVEWPDGLGEFRWKESNENTVDR